MSKQRNQKIKLLYLLDILRNETDESNHLTTNALIERLGQKGISVDRKTLYEDIKCLNANGYEILKDRNKSNEYYVVDRPFDIVELRIIRDALQSAKFLTEKKTKILIEKVSNLAGSKIGEVLKTNVVCSDTVKHTNEYIFYNTDTIHNCINENKKVSFLYFDYNINGEKDFRKNGQRYIVNPIELVLSEENYYLICCNDKYQNIISFRIDRMIDVEKEAEPRTEIECINTFDINQYKKEVFNMFGGCSQAVTLHADNSMVNIVMDQFGEQVRLTKIDDNTFSADVSVQISPTFFSWCFLFGDKLKVTAPEDVVLLIKQRLKDLQNCYY